MTTGNLLWRDNSMKLQWELTWYDMCSLGSILSYVRLVWIKLLWMILISFKPIPRRVFFFPDERHSQAFAGVSQVVKVQIKCQGRLGISATTICKFLCPLNPRPPDVYVCTRCSNEKKEGEDKSCELAIELLVVERENGSWFYAVVSYSKQSTADGPFSMLYCVSTRWGMKDCHVGLEVLLYCIFWGVW
jgi:hypothetical protein